MAIIEIELRKAKYEFLVFLLANRESLTTANKSEIIAELNRRNRSGDKAVQSPH